ncbi:unnamed protein product [Chrysoparadoxa australica]
MAAGGVHDTGDSKWNGSQFVGAKDVLVTHQGGKELLWIDLSEPIQPEGDITVMCGNAEMLEPNDVTWSNSTGRVFLTGHIWSPLTEAGDGDIWTCSAEGEAIRLDSGEYGRTNGIELSPDETVLYVSESFNVDSNPTASVVWQFDVDVVTGALANKRLFVDFEELDGSGSIDIDGIRADTEGNLYVTRHGSGKVEVLVPDPVTGASQLINTINLSFQHPTNLAFGGPEGRTLHVVGRCGWGTSWGDGLGCVDVWEAPHPGKAWSVLQRAGLEEDGAAAPLPSEDPNGHDHDDNVPDDHDHDDNVPDDHDHSDDDHDHDHSDDDHDHDHDHEEAEGRTFRSSAPAALAGCLWPLLLLTALSVLGLA